MDSYEFMRTRVPASFYEKLENFKKTPARHALIAKKKLRILGLKSIGYPLHYLELYKAKSQVALSFIKEKKNKEIDLKKAIIEPLVDLFKHPVKFISLTLILTITLTASVFIYKNVSSIIKETIALRAPASVAPEDLFAEIEDLKYKTQLGEDVFFKVKLFAQTNEEVEELEKMKEQIKTHLLALKFDLKSLPLPKEKGHQMERLIMEAIGGKRVVLVEVSQVLKKRPEYYFQAERQITFFDLNLQLFLEDTKRNRQVQITFTILASNRSIVLKLKELEVQARDHINMNVEPVIPQLPLDEESREIIKEKIKEELQNFIDKSKIEGDIQDIYINQILAS